MNKEYFENLLKVEGKQTYIMTNIEKYTILKVNLEEQSSVSMKKRMVYLSHLKVRTMQEKNILLT